MNINEAHNETLSNLTIAIVTGELDGMSPAEVAVWALDHMVNELKIQELSDVIGPK